jgi:hypothetical protein
MNIVKKHILKGNGEKGIALLFTLGILTVLLVLALGFATTSITQRRSAATNVQGTVARLLAESTLERVIGTLQIYDETVFAYSHCDDKTHPSSPTENRGRTDWLYRLGTTDTGTTSSGIFTWDSAYTDINWEFVTVNDGGVNKIIGRVAYVVVFVPLSGSGGSGASGGSGIDPGDLVKSGVDEKSNTESRPGVDVDEINLQSVDSSITSSIADKMNKVGTGAGKYNGNWVSFTNLFSTTGITNPATKTNFMKWFVIDANDDTEAYWADDNGDNAMNTNELYHRFNLARTDWDARTIAQILAAPVATDKYDASVGTYNGGGLRWLANFGKNASGVDDQSLKGTFSTVGDRRNQIAANLIDYCDGLSDGTNSSKHEVTRNSDTDPTYTGNEITPYINEIGVKVECTATVDKQGKKKQANSYDFVFTVYCEIANIYKALGTELSSTTTFEILDGSVTYSWKNSDGSTDTDSTSLADGAKTLSAVGGDNYKMTLISTISVNNVGGEKDKNNADATVTNVKVQIKRARLMYNGVFADFAKPDYDGGFSEIIPVLATQPGSTEGETTRSCCFSYQANDPRQNLNDGDWATASASCRLPATAATVSSEAEYGNAANGGNTVGTKDAVNGGVTFATDGDMESTLTPTTLSTSYIRNAAMLSPWEIGNIHRGARWETINLKECNKAAGVNPNMGGGLYTDSTGGSNPEIVNGGDANILDQIKMTPNVKSKQKVNLNLQSDDTSGLAGYGVLSALFKKIKVGAPYLTPGTGGTALTDADVIAIVNDIKSKSSTFKTRSNVARAATLRNRSGQTTDRTKEEIIGKIINLTTVAPTGYFTIIIMAQSIKDIGPGIFYKDLDMNGICTPTSKASEVALGADINGDGDMTDTDISEKIDSAGFGKYTQYADEIMAEQKIRADVYRDPITKKCTIIKMEYLEE